jgi:hypothetical protein
MGYLQLSSIYRWFFPYKPTSYWGFPIHGNPYIPNFGQPLSGTDPEARSESQVLEDYLVLGPGIRVDWGKRLA